MSLWTQFLNNEKRFMYKWSHYFIAYERHFGKFINSDVLFLEIGCGHGGSLQMWRRFFGPLSTIVGIDIRPECKAFEENNIHVRIGDQSDAGFIQSIFDEFGIPDAVLDDGSHIQSHVNTSFKLIYPRLRKNGVYMVEDLHTAYWHEYEGGLEREGTFIESCKKMIDELNADHTRGELTPTDLTASTLALHFYDSIAVFEKGRGGKNTSITTGKV